MTLYQILTATIISVIISFFIYRHIGLKAVSDTYKLWLQKDYWVNYNIVEALAWFIKAIIIIPALIFDINVWQLYIFSLFTSAMLIWSSNKKLLPTLVGFNTLWIWLSCMVLVKHMW
jgi:hypothetical protein